MRKLVIGAALAGIFLQGCSPSNSTAGTATPDVEASASAEPSGSAAAPSDFSEEVKAQAATLTPKLLDDTTFYQEARKKENGPVFVYLASTSEDANILPRAFQGMSETYTTYQKSTDKNIVDPAYLAAVRKGLASTDKGVLHWALQGSATTQLDDARDDEINKILNEIARNHAELAARYEALEALSRGSRWTQSEETVTTFTEALKGEPLVVSEALFRLKNKTRSFKNRSEVDALVLPLLDNSDPGVRGRAVELAVETVSEADKAQRIAKLESMLKDEHPYVRSQAAKALADFPNFPSAAKMMPLLEDKEKNTYDIKFDNLLGHSDSQHHDGSPWSRVDDATLWALQSMSNRLPEDKRFQYGKINHEKVDEDIAQEVKRAREWFEKNEAELSKTS